MTELFRAHGRPWLARRDPRIRVLTAIAASVAILALNNYIASATAVVLALLLAWSSHTFTQRVRQRLLGLNLFMLLLIAVLPLAEPGDPLFAIGPLHYAREGFDRAALIALNANAVLLLVSSLLGAMDPIHLGLALEQLGIPAKLTRLMLFTARYIGVIDAEYRQLRRAMRLRAFQPKANRHTLRALGYLVGMLLVRALDRSERIAQAMKCRGFTGHFVVARATAPGPHDWLFAACACATLAALHGIAVML